MLMKMIQVMRLKYLKTRKIPMKEKQFLSNRENSELTDLQSGVDTEQSSLIHMFC